MQKIKLCRNLKIKWEILKDGSAVTLDGLNLTLILVNYFGTREMAFSTDKSYVVCVIKDSEQLNPGEYWFALYQNYLTDKQSLVSVCDHFELVSDSHCCDSAEATIGGDSSCDCGPNLELGVQGDSAYAIWLKNGHEGTEEDFIAWLQEPSNEAAEKADTATQDAIQATADAKSATESANAAASDATAAASTANSAAQTATASAEKAQTATDDANNAASNANKMAEYANESASNANTATQDAKDATDKANASAKSADESAAYAKEQGDYAKSFKTKVDDIEASLSSVKELIPNTATSENQLADKEFVNSSITTNTATFKGTFETVDDLPTTDVKTNDYAFVIATDSTGNPEYQRYKYSDNAWAFEYTLNNSSFTAEQWAAITSGITSSKITTLEDADKSLAEKISTEATARESADATLQSNIDAEISAREEADATLTADAVLKSTTTTQVLQGGLQLGSSGANLKNLFVNGLVSGEANMGALYAHTILMGYNNSNETEFFEYGGVWNFWKTDENAYSSKPTDRQRRALGIRLGSLLERGNTLTYPNKSGTFALTDDVSSAIATHNTATDNHSDIRKLIPQTTEDWTFILEDGTEVTKTIYVK